MQPATALKVLLVFFAAVITAPAASAFNCCLVADVNGDGVVDSTDLDEIVECMGGPSPRKDLNGDGFVNMDDLEIVEAFEGVDCSTFCRADLDGDGNVNVSDLNWLEDFLGQFCSHLPSSDLSTCRTADLNRNGTVDINDRWFILSEWGACPGSLPVSSKAAGPPNPCAEGPVSP